jgi:phenylacetate-CoA ligase
VQEVFRCPVYNQYGSREVGAIAFEMQDQDGLRGLPYLNYVEVLDGRVVITCLTNYSMPFLRYDIGDTAERWAGPQDEDYGCRHKVFREVTGRIHSHFRTAGGGLVHGGFFAQQFYFLNWVRQFQVVQENLNLVSCRIVLSDQPVEEDLESIRRRMQTAMGPGCKVEFRFTDIIPPSPGGKHMYTVSNVSADSATC